MRSIIRIRVYLNMVGPGQSKTWKAEIEQLEQQYVRLKEAADSGDHKVEVHG